MHKYIYYIVQLAVYIVYIHRAQTTHHTLTKSQTKFIEHNIPTDVVVVPLFIVHRLAVVCFVANRQTYCVWCEWGQVSLGFKFLKWKLHIKSTRKNRSGKIVHRLAGASQFFSTIPFSSSHLFFICVYKMYVHWCAQVAL